MLNNIQALGIGGIGALVLLGLLRIFPGILDGLLGKKQKEEKRAIRGAKAEVQIDSLLSGLSEDYFVMNDINCPFGNIDHVVLSKNGAIFLIETKSHYGKVTFQDNSIYLNGHLPEKDFISQTLKNTYWLRERITEITGVKAWVFPIIVFTNAFVPFSNPIKGIIVVNQKFLLQKITSISNRSTANRILWEKKDNILADLDKRKL